MTDRAPPAARSLAFAGLARIPIVSRTTGPADRSQPQKVVCPKRLSRLSRWFDNWRARRRLWRIAAIDPRFASDIGLSIADIEFECSAPFWVDLPRGGLPDDAKEG